MTIADDLMVLAEQLTLPEKARLIALLAAQIAASTPPSPPLPAEALQPSEIIDRLEDWYLVADRDALRAFLATHPELLDLLLEGYPVIQNIFGKVKVMLHLEHNRAHGDVPFIVARMVVQSSTEEVVRALHELGALWWIDQIEYDEGHLSFTVASELSAAPVALGGLWAAAGTDEDDIVAVRREMWQHVGERDL